VRVCAKPTCILHVSLLFGCNFFCVRLLLFAIQTDAHLQFLRINRCILFKKTKKMIGAHHGDSENHQHDDDCDGACRHPHHPHHHPIEVLQKCYTSVTRVLEECHKCVDFHKVFLQGVTSMTKTCYACEAGV
jgi:hypothetical protein